MVWLLGEDNERGELYIHNPKYRALILRRDYDDLVDWLDRAEQMYKRYGARVVGRPATVKWPSGAKFRTGYLKNKSYTKYLGHEYQRVLIEELTQIGDEKHLDMILGSLRSTVSGIKPQAFFTTNPPGVGHLWVKKRFVTPAPKNTIFTGEDGRKRVYIPATLDDNPRLLKSDPNYIKFIESLKDKDPDLYRAWRWGDWDVMAGQFFKTFRRRTHMVDPFEPKLNLTRYAGVDWGMSAPFAFLAAALQKVEHVDPITGDIIKFNRLWFFREIYGSEKTPHEWAPIIKKSLNVENIKRISADPKMFHRLDDGSRSIASQFAEMGINMQPANNDRIAGWTVFKNWLSIAPDGLPYMMIGEQCVNLAEQIPIQIHDDNNVEDLDTDATEHAVDAARYLLMHVKFIDASHGTVTRPQKRSNTIPKHVGLLNPKKFM